MNEITIYLGDRKISALSFGNADAPVVLALHGWLDNAASFEKLAEQLQDHFQVIAIDFAGHGHSDTLPAGANFHFSDFVSDLDDIIHALNVKPAMLIGHSMGGAIASLYAGAIPENVSKLVLLDFIGPITGTGKDTAKQLRRFLEERRAYLRRESAPTTYTSQEEMIAARLRTGNIPHELAKKLVERNSLHDGAEYQWRFDRRLRIATPLRITEEQAHTVLKSIEAPTLFFLATETIAQYGDVLEKRAACVRNMELKIVEGHHYLHWEDAQKIAIEIIEFLK